MRIISGVFKGRKITPPLKNWPTRPTTDFTREALFNVLQNHFNFNEIKVLDLFGGTGAIGLEVISRGCQQVVFVDRFRKCVQFVQKIALEWEIASKITCIEKDCRSYIKNADLQFDFIFADPPYNEKRWEQLPELIQKHGLLLQNGWLVIEHSDTLNFSDSPGFFQERLYGQSRFSFFREENMRR